MCLSPYARRGQSHFRDESRENRDSPRERLPVPNRACGSYHTFKTSGPAPGVSNGPGVGRAAFLFLPK